MSAELVAFVRARLAEDEELARGAEGGKGPHGYFAVTGWCYFDAEWGDILPADLVNGSDAWKPARVLRSVAARRAILERYEELKEQAGLLSSEKEDEAIEQLEWVICQHAAEHAEHPDYRDEWSPGAPV
jgi:hypothetical protein